MNTSYKNVAKEYVRYRYQRELIRKNEAANNSILTLIDNKNQYLKDENSNKNASIASTQRDYMAGEISKDLSKRLLIPAEVIEAHEKGAIHFHDMDYFAQHIHNCCLVNLEDILQNGTVINGTKIEKPHSFSTACNIATQVAAIVSSNQYGGQTISLSHLAPFVDISRQKIIKEVEDELNTAIPFAAPLKGTAEFQSIVSSRLRSEIKRGVQMIQYQINTLMTTNGQTPFITVFMYLNECKDAQTKADLALIIEETLKQRTQGVKNEAGVWITPAFPKLIYVLEEDNCREGTQYWWLTKLAAQCSAKRMVPDYISEKKMIEIKGYCFPSMGCRSFLSPWFDENGKPKFYGRFNQGVVTLNLPYIAYECDGSLQGFYDKLDSYLEICHTALQTRHRRLLGTSTGTSPLHWQHGALARLGKDETIDKLLFGGYSTISLGYAGLDEVCHILLSESITSYDGRNLARGILHHMNRKCEEWKKEENIGYSVYGTPLESTTYKFAQALKKFGYTHNYVTNSYHVNVREPIDPFRKLSIESEFQELSSGGCISYIETSDLQNNIPAVLEVLKFIYDHIMYAELNTKSDYCQVCGSDGEIQIVNSNGKWIWKCPKCGNTDQKKMNVARRTCGYIGSNFWNQGRTEEIKERYVHLGDVVEVKQ